MQNSSLCRKQMYLRRSIVNILRPAKHNKVLLDLCSPCAHGKNDLIFPFAAFPSLPYLLQHLTAIMGIDSEMPPVGAISESNLAAEGLVKIRVIIFQPMLAPISCRLGLHWSRTTRPRISISLMHTLLDLSRCGLAIHPALYTVP